jgi:DNA-binding NtrC family response regulator
MSPKFGASADDAVRYHSPVKTLLVDIDRVLLQHCVNRIRGRQQLSIATSKAQVLSLLKHSPAFDVIVACERLEDGSGLALLDEVHTRWPNLTRVFCTERERLNVVRNRLGAFRLRYTLTYPLKPVKLELLLVHLAHTKAASTIRLAGPFGKEI